MTPERLREIERLFHEARERTPAEREAFLARACADDPTLRREVESLLAQPPAGVIDAPVGALVAELVAPPAPRLAPGSSVGPYRIESTARRRRHGRGVSRARHDPGPRCGDQDPPAALHGGPGTAGTLRAGSTTARRPQSSEHRRHLRPRSSQRRQGAGARVGGRRDVGRSDPARTGASQQTRSRSRVRSPMRSTPRTRKGSFTGISNRRISKSLRTAS